MDVYLKPHPQPCFSLTYASAAPLETGDVRALPQKVSQVTPFTPTGVGEMSGDHYLPSRRLCFLESCMSLGRTQGGPSEGSPSDKSNGSSLPLQLSGTGSAKTGIPYSSTLKRGLTVLTWVALNLLCNLNWPEIMILLPQSPSIGVIDVCHMLSNLCSWNLWAHM